MIETGIYFGDIHSYHDLNLVLSEVDIPPAEPKTTYIDVPGADGSVDLTEAHGEVKFSDRNCDFVFTMLPTDESTWEEKKTEVSNALNGKACRITLDKDDEYYYEGRCNVDKYDENKKIRQITISARVRPYKYKLLPTKASYTLTGDEQTLLLHNGKKPVSPFITCTSDNTIVKHNGAIYTMNAGTHKLLDIRLVDGYNSITVAGTGTITFEYQEADL